MLHPHSRHFTRPYQRKDTHQSSIKTITLLCMMAFATTYTQAVTAADNLIKTIPKKTYAIPAGDLGEALPAYAAEAGVLLGFEPSLTSGKKTLGLSGQYGLSEGFSQLLKGTGLEVVNDEKGGYTLKKAIITNSQSALPIDVELDQVQVRAKRFYEIGPLPGLGLTKEEIPGNVQSITAKQIKDSNSISMAALLNSQLQSVVVNDYQGNPFQMDVNYRGFTAGPQIGTPQGLSVFFDGIRVNEPFGDVVNWDMIPMNALAGVDVFPGSNPMFGLNTLGGAFAMRTKNGFDDPGVDTNVLAGAFGRKQFLLSAGGSKGDVAGFVALNLFDENGWRQNSPSKVNQIFSKLSYRNDNWSVDGSVLHASNNLVGNGLIPQEMFHQKPSSIYTSPDETRNDLLQFQIASAFHVSDTFNVTGQVYNRKSDRKASTGDVNTDISGSATRRALAGENPVCAFASTNPYGIPDYYVVSEAFGEGSGAGFSAVYLGLANGDYTDFAGAVAAGDIDLSTFNQPLPIEVTEFITGARNVEANMFNGKNGQHPAPDYVSNTENDTGNNAFVYSPHRGTGLTWRAIASEGVFYYTDPNDGFVTHYLVPAEPINGTCGTDSVNSATAQLRDGKIELLDNGQPIERDGRTASLDPTRPQTGYIDGTPTAVISNTQIEQIIKGGALQLNWNLEKHKFMVGASLDHARSNYSNGQMLGLLDVNRRAYLDPANIGAEYTAASIPVYNNDFNGLSNTRSIYFSETYSPQKNLHLSFAGRYNYTKVMTNMSTRSNSLHVDLTDYQGSYMDYLLCTGLGLDSCNTNLLNNPTPNSLLAADGSYANPYERESFTYHKFNPSVGVTWSPRDSLNLYANWNQGTRTPSAIELGCAFDDTPTYVSSTGGTFTTPQPRSLVNGTSCTLPTALSGDPYLPQVVSRTFEVGARGSLTDNLQWNASVYRTNLFDDIYFVGYTPTQSFFDTIGRTMRQGVELGFSGRNGKADFKVNYSLTDATFQSTFDIANADNSSVNHQPGTAGYNMQRVNPGNRMPGIPLHNLNATFGYQLTDKWRIGLNMVAHGDSFARGNENNKHQPGVQSYVQNTTGGSYQVVNRYISKGKTPGYAVFNFNTSYNFDNGWTAALLVNNLFDKEYYSGSRLGLNPFSQSIQGAIGANGFNYNSNDWNSTKFVAPGAPRGVWFSLNWQFDPNKK